MYVTHRSFAAPAPAIRDFFWLYHTYSLLRGGFYNASSGSGHWAKTLRGQLIMNQIIKHENTIICFKIKRKLCLRLKNSKSTVCLYESNNQASKCNLFQFKSACCYNHGTCLHLYTIHEPTNQASESNLL